MTVRKPKRRRLTPCQESAIGYLMTEPSIVEAARKTGIDERTLRKWLGQPNFEAAYRSVRDEATRQTSALLQGSGGAAVRTLLDVMRDEGVSGSARVAAARTILEFLYRGSNLEMEDLKRDLEKGIRKAEEVIFGDMPAPAEPNARRL
jgi:hypothetical protein